ncbi:ArsR family transcriptional regulator [Methanosarcina sp. KYL-1]|uniref:ArsR/SmtB family transcription factor n=1 Tax=Methanosarcina sp. KYL-1 TaxID=2602068 RepID=UPI0021015FB8|nr:ArsR family transcriptional regulator [Methanosarcina sp. KYL-1]MCQ1536466.1 ArsR family transcriptional regulator [Methanosarcina sp. KYL-1]
MDSATLLDILGNENRRKIIQLLANRPCYVSEISGRLGVGPKAIISHLGLLEQAGLIECSVDEQRRKYFNIANNMRLEVSVSPYAYTVSLHDIVFEKERKGETLAAAGKKEAPPRAEPSSVFLKLSSRLQELKTRQEELARMQQQLQAEYTELMDSCLDSLEGVARNPVECEVLFELLKNETTAAALCYNLRLHPSIINANLIDLAERGFIEYAIRNNQQYWRIRETGVEKA